MVAFPAWVQWVVAIGAIATALSAIIVLFYKLWPALTTFVRTVNALGDLPQFMVTTARTLADQDSKIDAIHHEVNYNNGSSVKDAVGRLEEGQKKADRARIRIEKGVKGLYHRAELEDELERTQPVVRRRTRETK